MLFSGTILQNVAYGLSGTPQAELSGDQKYELVEQACKAAYAHEFIEKLPEVKEQPLRLDKTVLLEPTLTRIGLQHANW